MPADIDIGQVIVIAIAMIAAFVQWVWKLIQDGKEARERARRQQERMRLGRESSVEKSTEPRVMPPQRESAPSVPKGGIWELVETLKEEMRKAQEQAAGQPLPPPIPVRPPEQRREPKPLIQPVIPETRPNSITPSQPVAIRVPNSVSKNTLPEGALDVCASVLNLEALKKAIILNEVLGPPKALQ